MVNAIFFLPPKEAQGKVRQSQGRAAANNFVFSRFRAKTDLRVHGTPLDHLRVNEYSYITAAFQGAFSLFSNNIALLAG